METSLSTLLIVFGIFVGIILLGVSLNAVSGRLSFSTYFGSPYSKLEGFQSQSQSQSQSGESDQELYGINSMAPTTVKCPETADSVLMCSPFRKCRCLHVNDEAAASGYLCHISTACYNAGGKKLEDGRVVYRGIPMCLPNQSGCLNDDISMPETSTPVFNTGPGRAIIDP
jgi:hypothetical protein